MITIFGYICWHGMHTQCIVYLEVSAHENLNRSGDLGQHAWCLMQLVILEIQYNVIIMCLRTPKGARELPQDTIIAIHYFFQIFENQRTLTSNQAPSPPRTHNHAQSNACTCLCARSLLLSKKLLVQPSRLLSQRECFRHCMKASFGEQQESSLP